MCLKSEFNLFIKPTIKTTNRRTKIITIPHSSRIFQHSTRTATRLYYYSQQNFNLHIFFYIFHSKNYISLNSRRKRKIERIYSFQFSPSCLGKGFRCTINYLSNPKGYTYVVRQRRKSKQGIGTVTQTQTQISVPHTFSWHGFSWPLSHFYEHKFHKICFPLYMYVVRILLFGTVADTDFFFLGRTLIKM